MPELTSLIVNTGVTYLFQSEALDEDEFAGLHELVIVGGGDIPGHPGWTFEVEPDLEGAYLSFYHGADKVAAATLALDQEAADIMWPAMEHLNRGVIKVIGKHNLPANWLKKRVPPASLPWVATVLLPDFVNHRLDQDWLIGFETALVWVIIDILELLLEQEDD